MESNSESNISTPNGDNSFSKSTLKLLEYVQKPNYDVVLENFLFLGNGAAAGDKILLENLQISTVVNVTQHIPNHFPDDFSYVQIPINDIEDAAKSLKVVIPNLISHLEILRNREEKVFVHCQMGVSRSATVVIAYLMHVHNQSFEEAFQFLKSKRPCVNPNYGFRAMLKSDIKSTEISDPAALMKTFLVKCCFLEIGAQREFCDTIIAKNWDPPKIILELMSRSLDKPDDVQQKVYGLIIFLLLKGVLTKVETVYESFLQVLEDIRIDVPYAGRYFRDNFLKPAISDDRVKKQHVVDWINKYIRNERLRNELYQVFQPEEAAV